MGLFTCFPLKHLGGFLSTHQAPSLILGISQYCVNFVNRFFVNVICSCLISTGPVRCGPRAPVGPPLTTETGLKGRVTVFSTYGVWGHVVNAKSEHIDEIVALLDWGLSPEAELLFNWGARE